MPMEPMLDSYNNNSAIQATCQNIGNPLLGKMAAEYAANRPTGSPNFVRIVDYGCSGGRNSFYPLNTMISTLRGASATMRAECILEDLPSNPWHQVMDEMLGLVAEFDGAVQVLCAGQSFYGQVCADQSVDLAYSYVASHFLSGSHPLSTHVLMHESRNGEMAAWQQQAARDWENFLLLRARELKGDGKIMISTMSRDQDGYSWQAYSHLVHDAIRKLEGKILSTIECETLCIPACLRSEEELLAPFRSASAVRGMFNVDSLSFHRTEVAGERDIPRDRLPNLLRQRTEAVWGGMFIAQLCGLGRTAAAATDAMRQVWDLFEEALSRDPEQGWRDMRFYCLQLTRTQ